MKRFFAFAVAASLSLFVAGSAMALDVNSPEYAAGQPANGIVASRHNLGATGAHVHTTSTTEVCVFCHTPHHTNTTQGVKPLWNRSVSNAQTLTAYGTTMANNTVSTSNLGSATLACLSCHDGLTSLDAIVNAPGKGGITVGGKSQGWSFEEGGSPWYTTMGNAAWSKRLNIGNLGQGGYNAGQGLQDDHPVSIVYTENVASLRAKTTNIASVAPFGTHTDPVLNDNLQQNRWAVKGYINTDATIDDILRNNPNVGGGKTVECSSCHDPHFKNMSWDEVDATWGIPATFPEDETDGLFLRRVGGNSGSGVCRTCHNK